MKMPTLPLRTAIVLIGIASLVLLAGCRNPFVRSRPAPGPIPVTTSGSAKTTPAGNESTVQQTVQTVTTYLNDLSEGRYDAAYNLLSGESQQLHQRADFERVGKKGMPLYDLKTAITSVDGETAMVEVRQLEDPATHGFHLVRESEVWKVVYRGGIPGQPTPEK